MHVGIACFLVFLIMAALMYTRRISALLALPLMAIAIAVVGQIPPDKVLTEVLAKGSTKLANAYTTTIFGAILAELINKLGIAKALIRWVAEFAGDEPFLLGISLTLVTALLFSSLGGLGAVIMVGTVVLPVMLSLGISGVTAGSLFLFGISLGGMFNLANWQLYISVLNIQQSEIAAYVLPFGGVIGFIILVFLALELRSRRTIPYLGVSALALGGLGWWWSTQAMTRSTDAPAGKGLEQFQSESILAVGVILAVLSLVAIYRHKANKKTLPGLAFATPALPLLLVLLFKWEIIPAFLAGITFGVLIAWQRDSVNLLTRSIIEGTQTVAPAVVLMLGIGMLLTAVMDPAISGAIGPMLTQIVPTQAIPYIATFTVLAPLALYRGPLSLWGMGSGIVALIKESTQLGAQAVMGMLMSVGQLQGICDPTNTQNVWIATYLGTDTQTLLRKTIPYAWLAVFCGLCLAVSFGYVKW